MNSPKQILFLFLFFLYFIFTLCAVVIISGYTCKIFFFLEIFLCVLLMSSELLVTSGQLTEDPDQAIISV